VDSSCGRVVSKGEVLGGASGKTNRVVLYLATIHDCHSDRRSLRVLQIIKLKMSDASFNVRGQRYKCITKIWMISCALKRS
jgi:hypothetical protein